MPKKRQKRVKLPEKWWWQLHAVVSSKRSERPTNQDIYEFTKISQRSMRYALDNNEMTEALFIRLAENMGYENPDDLLYVLNGGGVRTRRATPIPSTLFLTTQRGNPQWADYRDYFVEASRPWVLRCNVETKSPYFRFGFKLLGPDGRVFGDGSIKSGDENMIVHIGRNYWDRPALGIMAQDIFLTAYANGNHIGEEKSLFNSEASVVVSVELTVDRSYCASLTVNGNTVFQAIVTPAVCRRVVVYAWGDQDEFEVNVTDLAVTESAI